MRHPFNPRLKSFKIAKRVSSRIGAPVKIKNRFYALFRVRRTPEAYHA